MAVPRSNRHMTRLIANVGEVDRLKKIHRQVTPKGPGRKYDVAVLHKSAIVLLVACWEAYVEDLASETLLYMIRSAPDHSVFPDKVLERVGSKHSGKNAWDLAGDGWKKALKDNFKEVLQRTTGTLNTPKTAQIDTLFKQTIGLEELSSSWHWKGRSTEQATQILDELVTLRGSIAHRVATSESVTLKHVGDSRSFIYRLAVLSNNRVCRFLAASKIGKSPWEHCVFGSTG